MTLVTARDDEPQFVKDFGRKSLSWVMTTVIFTVTVYAIGFVLPAKATVQAISIPCFVVSMGAWVWWARKNYPPVRAWREAWLREHQVANRTNRKSETD